MLRLDRLTPVVVIVALSLVVVTSAHADSGGPYPTIVITPSDALTESPTLTFSGGCPTGSISAFLGFPGNGTAPLTLDAYLDYS